MQKSFKARMEALEQLERQRQHRRQRPLLTALDRAYDLLDRDVPLSEWPDAELNAYCEVSYREWPRLRTMSDAELEALIENEPI